MTSIQTVAIACDHAGISLKKEITEHFKNIHWIDFGTQTEDSVDYPDYADKVVGAVKRQNIFGVLICGTGIGMSMRANRYSGIRAAVVCSEKSALLTREHNNANIICLGARMIDVKLAIKMIEIFLNTEFSGDKSISRHALRIKKMDGKLNA